MYAEIVKYANETLQYDFGDQDFDYDKVEKYVKTLGENNNGNYDLFKAMLARVKRSTLYKNQKEAAKLRQNLYNLEQLTMILPLVSEQEPKQITYIPFILLIAHCYYINKNYIPYIPFCEDFDKL